MEKKIVLDHTQLYQMDADEHPAGPVAIAIAMKRPGDYQAQPGEPDTSPCWLAAVVAADSEADVDKIRKEFASIANIDPCELRNVISARTGGGSDLLAKALQAVGPGDPAPDFLGRNISIFSCSVGGRMTRVTTGAGGKPQQFVATWGLAKGTQLPNGDCACKEIRVWTRNLTPAEVKDFSAEVATFGGFKCE